MKRIPQLFLLACLVSIGNFAFSQTTSEIQKKVLFVVTSHSELGNTGKETGYYLSEVAHPWKVLHEAGYEIDFVSPQGGNAPVDGFDLKDEVNREFWKNKKYHQKVESTLSPKEVNPTDYVAIHYAGGHGTMWDFPDNVVLAKIAGQIYDRGGVISAVCHGPAGIVNIKLKDGSYLVKGKQVSAFTNEEESAAGLTEVVPFLLEDKLKERGALIEKNGNWKKMISIDNRLVTGQNPASAEGVGEGILSELKRVEKAGER